MSVESLVDVDSFRATTSGFTCNCTGEPREFRDEDVVGLRIRKERAISPDGTAKTHERLSIRVADPSVPIVEVDAEYSGPDDNFLAPFRDRQLDGLAARATETIQRSGEFDGGLWTIGLEGLTDKRSNAWVSLESIARVAWRNGQFCIWRNGSDQAAVQLGADEENTYLLAQLTRELLQLEVGESDGPDVEPGRNVYEFRDTSYVAQVALGAVGGVGVVLTISMLRPAWNGQPLFFAAAGTVAVATLAGLGLVYWKLGTTSILRLFDNALALVHRGRETILPLGNLAGFSAHWTDHYRNGVYQQTRVQFQFASADPSVPPLKYDAQATYGAPKFGELQRFQTHVAAVVARRMCDDLASAGRVRWTDRLNLLSDGIEFTKKAGGEPRVIAFSQITQWEVDQGLIKLAIDGSSKPNIVEPTDQTNFYPGLVLFTQLVDAPGSRSALFEGVHFSV